MISRIFSALLRIKRVHVMATLLAAVLLVAAWGLFFDAPKNFPIGETVVIEEGSTTQEIAQTLHANDVIKSKKVFLGLTRTIFNANSIKAGEYYFSNKVGPLIVAYRLAAGIHGVEPVSITFPEGFTTREMGLLIEAKFPHISAQKFQEEARPLEGYLFPDTYRFSPNVSIETILVTMHAEFEKQIAALRAEQDFTEPLSDVVIMASLLEKEARQFETKRIVSGILWNRLEIGMPLQVDAVFGYIHDRNTFNPTFADLEIDSPYNTYKYSGLPPGPISNPGIDSLKAAINPTETEHLFYLTGRDGEMRYAETFEGHKRNRALYLD